MGCEPDAGAIEERRYLGELGWLGISLPEEYGGSGAPLLAALVVQEELAKQCRPAAFQVFEANTGPAKVISLIGTEEQKQRLLPGIVSGDITMAVAISEPDAGSAATDMTPGQAADGTWTLNGFKRWISNGGEADLYSSNTRPQRRPRPPTHRALIVEKDRRAELRRAGEVMGFRGIPSPTLISKRTRARRQTRRRPGGSAGCSDFSIERLGTQTIASPSRRPPRSHRGVRAGAAPVRPSARRVPGRADDPRRLCASRLYGSAAAPRTVVTTTRAPAFPTVRGLSVREDHGHRDGPSGSPTLAMQMHRRQRLHRGVRIERLHRDAHGWAIAGGTDTIQPISIVSEL